MEMQSIKGVNLGFFVPLLCAWEEQEGKKWKGVYREANGNRNSAGASATMVVQRCRTTYRDHRTNKTEIVRSKLQMYL